MNAGKSPRSVFWNSLASPRVSQRNGAVHYLLHHLYSYCTSKQSSHTTKSRWGLILHYLTPTLCSPLETKPFLSLKLRNWTSPALALAFLDLSLLSLTNSHREGECGPFVHSSHVWVSGRWYLMGFLHKGFHVEGSYRAIAVGKGNALLQTDNTNKCTAASY